MPWARDEQGNWFQYQERGPAQGGVAPPQGPLAPPQGALAQAPTPPPWPQGMRPQTDVQRFGVPQGAPATPQPQAPQQPDLLQGLLASLNTPLAGPGMVDILSVAMAGLGAGLSGQPNPVLQQRAATRDAKLKQTLEIMRLQGEVEQRRFKKLQTEMDFGRALLESQSPAARKAGADIMLRLGKDLWGFDAPPGLADQLAKAEKNPKEIKAVAADIESGRPLDQIAADHPNLGPSDFAWVKQGLGNDTWRQTWGVQTKAAAAKAKLDLQEKERSAKLSSLGIHGDSMVAAEAREILTDPQGEFKLQKPEDAAPDQAFKARGIAQYRKDAHQRFTERLNEERLGVQKALAQALLGNRQVAQFTKLVDPLLKSRTSLVRLKLLDGLVDKLPNLPSKGAARPEVWAKAWAQWWSNPAHPDLREFRALGNEILVGISRGDFGEIGVRFKGAFEKQLELIDQPTSSEAMHQAFRAMMSTIASVAAERIKESSKLTQIDPAIQAILGGLLYDFQMPDETQLDIDYGPK